MTKNYYEILGVPRNASEEDIKRAYYILAHQYHPDKNNGKEKRFKEINEAYRVLSSQSTKTEYDKAYDTNDFSNLENKREAQTQDVKQKKYMWILWVAVFLFFFLKSLLSSTSDSDKLPVSQSATQTDDSTSDISAPDIDKDQEHRVAQKICQAIAEIKTNKNYDTVGKSNSFGAYEYTQGFWDANSQKYFGVSSLEVTPDNQDKLCLAWIYDRLNKSFNVPQVISMWIAGDKNPNAYLDPNYKGVNKFGEYYDVPAQVKAIQDRFDTLNGW